MMKYRSFTGGIFETNCYALEAPEGWILFDAPDGTCDWLVREGIELRLLLLTHGHIDHIQDVAKIKKRFGCPVGVHPDSAPMISDANFFRDFGFQFEIEPVQPDLLIEATPARDFLGMNFEILEVPGHCPGSLCFFSRENELLIGGDVLFAGGVGRWDLPGRRWRTALRRHSGKTLSVRRQRHRPARPRPADHDRRGAARESLRAPL